MEKILSGEIVSLLLADDINQSRESELQNQKYKDAILQMYNKHGKKFSKWFVEGFVSSLSSWIVKILMKCYFEIMRVE